MTTLATTRFERRSPRPIAVDKVSIDLLAQAEQAAQSDAKILLTGESGAGKDVIAQHIHSRSRRSAGEYIAINCAGLTESLLESELFGHVKGSFTGAHRDK